MVIRTTESLGKINASTDNELLDGIARASSMNTAINASQSIKKGTDPNPELPPVEKTKK
jgi:hypothetical protein